MMMFDQFFFFSPLSRVQVNRILLYLLKECFYLIFLSSLILFKNRGIYMFRIDSDAVVDATMAGGPARYINHSCDVSLSILPYIGLYPR